MNTRLRGSYITCSGYIASKLLSPGSKAGLAAPRLWGFVTLSVKPRQSQEGGSARSSGDLQAMEETFCILVEASVAGIER